MVRIIPRVLKGHSTSNANSTATSRSASPMRNTAESSSPEARKDAGLALHVVILRGRNLAAKDRGGTSDPYLVLCLGDARHVTHAVPKSLNPEWHEQCQLPVSGVHSLLLDVICWDKDRFGKDYLGEFALALEELFSNGKVEQKPKWYPLKSKRPGKKTGVVSGEVLLQFRLLDTNNKDATPQQIHDRFAALVGSADPSHVGTTSSMTPVLSPTRPQASVSVSPSSSLGRRNTEFDEEDDNYEVYEEETIDDDDLNKSEAAEGRRRRLRIRGLKAKKRQDPYEFSNGGGDMVGIIYLEICKITDLPPESNLTKTSFDMDPFVVATLGKKTYRTKKIRHNLNPVYKEKLLFQVLAHEQTYQFSFTVIDYDKYSGNDFIASVTLPVKELLDRAPKAVADTGLYNVRDPPEYVPAQKRFMKLSLSRSPSAQNVAKPPTADALPADATSAAATIPSDSAATGDLSNSDGEEADFHTFVLPLKMKNQEKWEDKHSPQLYVRAKYVPYPALRQQFWRAMLKQYDTDGSGCISKVELTTMLDTLGSTLRESTINGFFRRFPHAGAEEDDEELTFDEAVVCLEDQLQSRPEPRPKPLQSAVDRVKGMLPDVDKVKDVLSRKERDGLGPEADALDIHDLNLGSGEEHVVEIRECPVCHQPRLNRRRDADIITHIATCASQDWRQVNTLVMGGFVTASQAQRKWYSKVITAVTYGGYKLGANSANILVQDRITGQITEEKMSIYVRLGIRLLYKGLKSKDMENKRIRKLLKGLSIKQGKKYDAPDSRSQIQPFITFHGLDMSEVLLPVEEFRNFNEFFYRALKPDARPCSAPDKPRIAVSPADCRSVVFNHLDTATNIWIKGRDFSIRRLIGAAYPDDVARYEAGGALGIFRLAPQDYHRFHVPVDGVMGEPRTIAGEYYTVNPMAIRSALDVYGENVRVIVPIDSPVFGRVMVVCVGAMMVGSTVITRTPGEHVSRAEELGYFKFGGSTVVLLFEPGNLVFDDDLVDNSTGALETLIRVGMSIGHAPGEPQWTPDMRKADVTEADMKEAKRRIQGNVNDDEESLDDSSGGDDADVRAPAA